MSLGEAYMDDWWDCDKLDEFFYKILPGGLDKKVRDWKILIQHIRTSLLNPQRKSKAFHIGEHHYDMGNELYKSMLDKRLTYTCACWKDTKTLDQAQEAKLDLVARKIGLKEGRKSSRDYYLALLRSIEQGKGNTEQIVRSVMEKSINIWKNVETKEGVGRCK